MESKITIILGFFVLFLAAIAFYIPQILHHEAEQPIDEISMAHSNNLGISRIDFNFITRTDPQILYVNYNVNPLHNENGTLSILIPYQGKVVETPDNWQIKNFSSTDSIVLFKNFTCTKPTCPGEDGTIQYNLINKIDSWRFPNHYTQIPFFSNAPNSEINIFTNNLSKQISWPFSFGWDKATVATLKITIDKEFDEWETSPISRISSIPNPDGGRNIILEWDLIGSKPIFIAKYSSSKDHTLLFYAQGAMGFGVGVGIGLILDGLNIIRNNRQQKRLQNFIKVQRHMQDANTAFILKNYESAKQSYDLASKKDPEDVDPLLLAGNSFYEMRYFEEAIPYYEKVLKIDQKYVGALNNVGACYAGLGNHEKAIDYYEKVLEINPNHLDTLNNFGAAISDLGFPEYAIPYFDEVLKINKKDVMAIANKGKAISYNNYENALTFYDEALKINPNKIEPLTFKALSLISLARDEEALACLNLILKIDPLNKEAIHNLGTVLINLNRPKEALYYYNEFLVTRPQDSHALFNKGLCYASLGDKTKTIACFNDALKYGTKDHTILNKIGGHFTLYGDPNRAIKECFQKILDEDENNINALYGMSLAFAKLKNETESEAWHQKYLNALANSISD